MDCCGKDDQMQLVCAEGAVQSAKRCVNEILHPHNNTDNDVIIYVFTSKLEDFIWLLLVRLHIIEGILTALVAYLLWYFVKKCIS